MRHLMPWMRLPRRTLGQKRCSRRMQHWPQPVGSGASCPARRAWMPRHERHEQRTLPNSHSLQHPRRPSTPASPSHPITSTLAAAFQLHPSMSVLPVAHPLRRAVAHAHSCRPVPTWPSHALTFESTLCTNACTHVCIVACSSQITQMHCSVPTLPAALPRGVQTASSLHDVSRSRGR